MASPCYPCRVSGKSSNRKIRLVSKVDEWKVGGKSTLRITLVTADYAGLACSYDKEFAGKHCANKSETEAWPRDPNQPLEDNKANVIQPYRTWNDNRLVMVAGLWATPAWPRACIEPLRQPCPRSWRVSSHSATCISWVRWNGRS